MVSNMRKMYANKGTLHGYVRLVEGRDNSTPNGDKLSQPLKPLLKWLVFVFLVNEVFYLNTTVWSISAWWISPCRANLGNPFHRIYPRIVVLVLYSKSLFRKVPFVLDLYIFNTITCCRMHLLQCSFCVILAGCSWFLHTVLYVFIVFVRIYIYYVCVCATRMHTTTHYI